MISSVNYYFSRWWDDAKISADTDSSHSFCVIIIGWLASFIVCVVLHWLNNFGLCFV